MPSTDPSIPNNRPTAAQASSTDLMGEADTAVRTTRVTEAVDVRRLSEVTHDDITTGVTQVAFLMGILPPIYSLYSTLLMYPMDNIHFTLVHLIFVVAIPALIKVLYDMFGLATLKSSSADGSTTYVSLSQQRVEETSFTSTDHARGPVTMVVPSRHISQPEGVSTTPPTDDPPAADTDTHERDAPQADPSTESNQTTSSSSSPVPPPHRYTEDCAQMVAELLKTVEEPSANSDEWKEVYNQTSPTPLQVYQKKGADFCFKMVAVINNTAETAFDLLADATRRPEWDDMCQQVKVVENLDNPTNPTGESAGAPPPTTKIQYVRTKPIWPTAARDVCLLSHNCRLPGHRYMSVTQSVLHPECPEYTAEGIVRMTAGIAGQIVYPLSTGADGTQPSCRVVQIADGNPGGWLPQSVVRFVATKAMPQSFKKVAQIIEGLPQQNESHLLPPVVEPSVATKKETTTTTPAPPAAASAKPSEATPPQSVAKYDAYATQCDQLAQRLVEMADSALDDPQWQIIYNQTQPRLLQVYQKIGADYCFKIVGDIENSMYTAFDLLSDALRRPGWDSLCAEARILEPLPDTAETAAAAAQTHTKIQYLRMKPIWPTSARDTCVLSHSRAWPDGRLVNVTKSVEHPACPDREKSDGLVRMVAGIAGQVIGPIPSDDTSSPGDGHPRHPLPTAPRRCRVVQIIDGDPKGWIPKSVTKFVATKAVPGSFKKLNQVLANLPVQSASDLLPPAPTSTSNPAPAPASAPAPHATSMATTSAFTNGPTTTSPPIIVTGTTSTAGEPANVPNLARAFTQEELALKIIALENRIVTITEENNNLLRKALLVYEPDRDSSTSGGSGSGQRARSNSMTTAGTLARPRPKWTWVRPLLQWIVPIVAASVWTFVLPKWKRR
ncbi:hypothetical protein H4R33_005543 [Dimargaris cristalligena]|nr:hypothetical protein H4R33_005543 [Dimargaris cristalligena]